MRPCSAIQDPNLTSGNLSMSRDSTTSLAPGFRFHPTDEELVRYFLKRKVSGKPLRFDPISEVDVYKSEPWDLPAKSKLKTRDREWYFFSVLDKKYGNGYKTNRATEKGYWKTTGKDRPIHHYTRAVGMKKTLVYHEGRAPRGLRSNWVMHEYRLTDEELEKAGIAQDAFVLCRIFQKSGPGPKNGEQYGAPLVEEEWENDAVAFFPNDYATAEDVVLEDDIYVETSVLDQAIPVGIPIGLAPLPVPETTYYGNTSSENEQSGELSGNARQEPENGEVSHYYEQSDENKYFSLPEQNEDDVKSVKREFAGPSSNDMNLGDGNYVEGPFMDANDNPLLGDEIYLDDLSFSVGADPDGFNVEDYLTFFDTDGENMMVNDPNALAWNDDSTSMEQLQPLESVCGGDIEQMLEASEVPSTSTDGASSSRQDKEPEPLKPDFKHAFFKQASHMLGAYPAPPAYASEYPIKGINTAAAHASSPIHVTAGMIRIRNLTLSTSGTELSVGKNGELNIVLSIGLSHGETSPVPAPVGYKTASSSVVSWSWALFLFLWVILLSVSAKIGVSVYSR